MSDEVIHSIYQKIEREKVLINAAVAMRASSNPQVQQSLDAQIKEGRKNLSYLEERLQELEVKRMGQNMQDMSMQQQGGPSGGQGGYGQHANDPYGNAPAPPPKGGYDYPGYGHAADGYGYQDQMGGGQGMMPPRAPYGPQAPNSAVPKSRPNYSRLDLIKADTKYLGPRFQLMLSQLTFKLSVEKQYKDGIEKLVRLYSYDGDKRSRADAEARRIESNQKIQLLKQALKRYEDLHVDMEPADAPDDDSINSPQLRKPLTGQLSMRVHAVQDLNHAMTGRFARAPETFCIIKVEDTLKARTRSTRTDKWTDEYHLIDVDKANEIDVTVYDKTGTYPTPVGMLWVRISDLVEEMRRKKIESELSGSQWVTAEQMDQGGGGGGGSGGGHSAHGSLNSGSTAVNQLGGAQLRPPGQSPGGDANDPNVIEAWFSLEPVGSIKLSMSFTKQNKGRANFDAGLGRKGAVRQRKEEVMEQYGHKFVTQQFYSIMRCALCGEYLKNAAGMQCEDCKYTCHRNCFPKVVTKCISKSNAETDPDEETLNHHIPHRFEPFSNISANWCCHCGYLLPFGKKNARKCSECSLTVHAGCSHLVPNFCGMSMLRANEILKQMKAIRPPPHNMTGKTMRDKPARPSPGQSPSFDQSSMQESLKSNRPASYPYEQYEGQSPPASQMSMGALAASNAAKSYAPQQQQDRPPQIRTYSQDAAAAAAAAAAGGRAQPQKSPPYSQTQSTYGQAGERTSAGYPQADPRQQQQQQQRMQQPVQPAYNPRDYAQFDNGYGVPPPQQTQQNPQQQQHQQPLPQQQQPQQQMRPQQPQQYDQHPQEKMQGRPVGNELAKQSAHPPTKTASQRQARVGLENFNFLAVLGKGNFGKVMLAETKASKKLYAIKVLKKEFIIENDEVESTKSEKRVFLIANKEKHPFLLNLHACFQTETRVYFVMEYISGGDLMWHIQRGQFGLKRAQFYAAEVCLALKYFHENGVIYRDLKLDNIMLTLDGHIKVADYGLCKENMWYGSTTSTFCGTPEFMAPEILLDRKYERAVDWWAFGVLIYQMLLQQSPFRGEDEDEIYDAILADEPLYPIHMPRDSVSILQKLLTREPELRLGSGPTDAQEIMSHAFFRNINWEDIRNLRIEPPFKPQIKNATDTSNFDSEFTSVTPVLTPVQSVLTQQMQEEFRGFSYSADFS